MRTALHGGIVAVVDDDESLRAAIRSLLRSLGFPVEVFASAEDFLLWRPRMRDTACVIVDVRMPGMSGLDLQRALVATGRPLPTIVISAHDDAAARQQALRAGALTFLAKPFGDNALIAAVRSAVGVAASQAASTS